MTFALSCDGPRGGPLVVLPPAPLLVLLAPSVRRRRIERRLLARHQADAQGALAQAESANYTGVVHRVNCGVTTQAPVGTSSTVGEGLPYRG